MRFICDITLGKLARYLRALGFDTVRVRSTEELEPFYDHPDHPAFLTKRTKPVSFEPSIIIRSDRVMDQIREVMALLDPPFDRALVMTRCIECNSPLETVTKESIEGRVPEYIYHHSESFKVCPSCGRVYWEGTHAAHMRRWIDAI